MCSTAASTLQVIFILTVRKRALPAACVLNHEPAATQAGALLPADLAGQPRHAVGYRIVLVITRYSPWTSTAATPKSVEGKRSAVPKLRVTTRRRWMRSNALPVWGAFILFFPALYIQTEGKGMTRLLTAHSSSARASLASRRCGLADVRGFAVVGRGIVLAGVFIHVF
jgi:hypothetical protein